MAIVAAAEANARATKAATEASEFHAKADAAKIKATAAHEAAAESRS